MDARRHKRGEAVERRQEQRIAPTGTRLGAFMEQAFGIQFAQPIQANGGRAR